MEVWLVTQEILKYVSQADISAAPTTDHYCHIDA